MSEEEEIVITHPDRLFAALMKEWEKRETIGFDIPPELQILIKRYLGWSCIMSAESVIHIIQKRIELTPHNNNIVRYNTVMEIIRQADPESSSSFLTVTPREYKINNKISEPKIKEYEKR